MYWMVIQAIINGLLMGGVYALVAVGLTIIFGVMKMLNFAQGEFLMIGMYVIFVLVTLSNASVFVMMLPAAIIMLILGYAIFHLCMKPLIGKDKTNYILLTVGLAFFLENFALSVWGASFHSIETSIKEQSIKLGEFTVGLPRVIACAVVIVLVVIISIVLAKTNWGRAMRATAENTEISQMLGINTTRTYAIAFMIGIALAGIAGFLLTPMYYIHPKIGASFKVTAMVIIVLGGMGNISGAMVGGFIAGVVEALIGTLIDFNLAPAGIFILLLLILYYRPQGLFGKKERTS